MPRELHPDLRACLERANPNVRIMVEMSAPDTEKVLRRSSDQFFTSPPMVSIDPPDSLVASVAGSLQLASTGITIADQDTEAAFVELKPFEDRAKFLSTFRWVPDASFDEAVLWSFSGKFYSFIADTIDPIRMKNTRMELQIYRAVATPLWKNVIANGIIKAEKVFTQWTFAPLLSTPQVVRPEQLEWGEDGYATVTWNFQNEGLKINSRGFRYPVTFPASKQANGEKAAYYFVVGHNVNASHHVEWVVKSGAESVSDIGTFQNVLWQRPSGKDSDEWQEVEQSACPVFELKVERYDPEGGEVEAIYELDLGREPAETAFGRVVFERSSPAGSSVTMELSVDGEDGPFDLVSHDTLLETVQQVYHARLVFTPNEALTATPSVHAFGIQYREPFDVSPEVRVEPLSADANVPFLESSIGEGKIRLLRTGRRDYLDRATWFGANISPPKVEADIFLGSDHPNVGREKWFLLDRAVVSNRVPSETAEEFTLLSIASRLKRKVPPLVETINSVHRVVAYGTDTITVSPQLVGVTPTGNEYDGQNFIMRVRSSATPGANGWTAIISGNTGVDVIQLVTGSMPFALLPVDLPDYAGDVIEVHSAIMRVEPIEWVDEDPAVIWLDILTNYAGIPEERIGLSGAGRAGRSGLPPLCADIDPVNFDMRKVTMRIEEETEADKIIDQLSFLMGGITTVIAGQICFVQVYPMADSDGNVTIRPQDTTKIFDPRDVNNLHIPPGLEQRSTFMQCSYGADKTSRNKQTSRITSWVDVDALDWLTHQDLEVVGASSVPDDIARWCFNSEDTGRFLASEAARQVVQAASTGLRVATWNTIEMHPELQLGDTVVLSTDIYTDYDPKLGRPIFGWKAIHCVLVGIAGNRRGFRGYVLGLREVSDDIGGRVGSKALKRPKAPHIQSITFNSFGDMKLKAFVSDEHTAALRLGWSYESQEAANEMAELTGDAPDPVIDNNGNYNFSIDGPFDTDVVIYVCVMPFALPEATAPGDPAEAEAFRTSAILMPVLEEIFREFDDHAELYLKVVEDPQERLLSVDYSSRPGVGEMSAFGEAALTAIPSGLDASGDGYLCVVALVEKHISTINYRVHGYNSDNDEAIIIRNSVAFQAGQTPGIPVIYPTIDKDGTLDVIVVGDSDCRSSLLAWSTEGFDEAKLEDGTRFDGRITSFPDVVASLEPGTVLYLVARSFSLTISEEETPLTPLISEWAERKVIAAVLKEQGTAIITLVEVTDLDVTVSVDGTPDDDDTEVELVSVEGSTAKTAGANVAVVVPGGSEWTFSRGAPDSEGKSPGLGYARFRVVVPGFRPDEDVVVIPDQLRDDLAIKLYLTIVSASEAGMRVRLYIADDFPLDVGSGSVGDLLYEVEVLDSLGVDSVTPVTVDQLYSGITTDIETTSYLEYDIAFTGPSSRVHGFVDFIVRSAVWTGGGPVTTDDRVPAVDRVDISPVIERSVPNLTLTVDKDGDVRAVVVGDSAVLSYKWIASTSAMPSDATVDSAGAVVNGNSMSLSAALSLEIGQRCYFKALPYYFVSGGGTHGQGVSGEIDRVDTIGAPGVTLDYDSAGVVSALVSGLSSTKSFKYLASTSSMPSDSAVRAETAVNGSSLSLSAIATLVLLQACYFKVTAYTDEDGGGEESPFATAVIMRVDTVPPAGIFLGDPDEGGDVPFSISGHSDTASIKYATSTTDYPSVATVQAAGAVNASHLEGVIDANLEFGDVLYMTALLYTAADGGGEESPPGRAKIARQNRVKDKVMVRAASGFQNTYLLQVDIKSDGSYASVGEDSGKVHGYASINVALPPGSVITGWAMVSACSASGTQKAELKMYKSDGAGGLTPIATLTNAGSAGAFTTTSDLALDEEVGGEAYIVQLELDWTNAGGSPTKFAEMSIFYTAPDLSISM